MSQTEQKREYGEATALEIMRALGLSSHDLPKLARYARECFEDGAAEQRRKDAEGQGPIAWVSEPTLQDILAGYEGTLHFGYAKTQYSTEPLYTRPANVAALETRIAELEGENGDKGLAAVHLLGILHRPDLTKTQKIEAAKRQLDAQFITGELRAALTREGGV